MGLYVNTQEAKSNCNDKKPEISVNVCTYNRAEMLHGALESLICQETDGKFSYEIVVVDNASTDNTKVVVEQVATNCPVSINYIYEEKKGVAQARNRGVRESRGAWIAFIDDDQLAEPNWLKELFEFVSNTGIQCVGGARTLYLSEREINKISPICRSILGEIDQGKEPKKCGRKTFPCTGNALIKRTVFDDVGYFDESLMHGGTDTDFFLKVRKKGLDGWYSPKAVVYHLIPTHRLKKDYLFWASIRYGASFAFRDYKEWGKVRLLLSCIARIGQALLVNLPILLLEFLLGNDAEVLGRKCLLWRAMGYIRSTLFLLAPRLFTQESYFARLEFRKERKTFTE